MQRITYTEFIRRLTEYGCAVHCEMYTNLYTRCYSPEEPGECTYSYDRGCVIRSEDYDYGGKRWICRYIHQVQPDAEIDAVGQEQLANAREYAKQFDAVFMNVIAFTVSNGDLPPEKDCFFGWRNYVRMGEAVIPDGRVRLLTDTPADVQAIRACCAPSLTENGDTVWGRMEAESFAEYDFEGAGNRKLYGIFADGVLAGMADSVCVEALGLAWLMNIYITPAYRRRGFGQALVLTALSAYPDRKWHYQAARDNTPSAALARSLGFTLEGAGLSIG